MRIAITPRFVEESRKFVLRRHCEDCALYDPQLEQCAHGYPTDDHRADVADEREVVFCKDFDMA